MAKKASLQAIGLCGVDDSVHPNQLVLFAHRYPLVEFGVLFRPDWEGQPRYPSKEWIDCLSKVINKCHDDGSKMKVAAHLCGHRVDDLLQKGDEAFVRQLSDWGFGRVQINARAINISKDPSGAVVNFLKVAGNHPELEFILQKNAETRPLWEGVLEKYNNNNNIAKESKASSPTTAATAIITGFPSNVSMLLDESKGTGVLPKTWPQIPPKTPYKIGYAGGIGPSNVSAVLSKIRNALVDSQHHHQQRQQQQQQTVFWIDMESSLRSHKNGKDVFDLDKCYRVSSEVCDGGFALHPPFLERDAESTEPDC